MAPATTPGAYHPEIGRIDGSFLYRQFLLISSSFT